MNGAVLIHRHIMGGDENGNAGNADTAEGLIAVFADVQLAEAAMREALEEQARVMTALRAMLAAGQIAARWLSRPHVTPEGQVQVIMEVDGGSHWRDVGMVSTLAGLGFEYEDLDRPFDLEIVEMEIRGLGGP